MEPSGYKAGYILFRGKPGAKTVIPFEEGHVNRGKCQLPGRGIDFADCPLSCQQLLLNGESSSRSTEELLVHGYQMALGTATSLRCLSGTLSFEFFACLLTLNYVVCIHNKYTKCVLFPVKPLPTWEMQRQDVQCTVYSAAHIVLLSKDKESFIFVAVFVPPILLRKFCCFWQGNLSDITKENCRERKNLLVTQ